eukprot:jgi/Galph1/5486/GphlegSOOS_G4143.1
MEEQQLVGPLVTKEDIEEPKWYLHGPCFENEQNYSWKTARKLVELASSQYRKKSVWNKSALPKAFVESTQKSGTFGDKVSDITTIEEAPLYSSNEMENVLALLERKSRRDRILALQTLKDLFLQVLLPDRYLVSFSHRNFQFRSLTKRHLIYALFESNLKQWYQRYLLHLEELSQDPLEYPKTIALKIAKELVEKKPEGERFLLALIINKLGDPSKQLASKSSYFLQQILFKHPKMQLFVANEVMQFCVRPKLPIRGKHYALNFLSLLQLSNSVEEDFLQTLLGFYLSEFHQFRRTTNGKNASEEGFSKCIAYILKGIKQCLHVLQERQQKLALKKDLSAIYQIAKTESSSDWLDALELLLLLGTVDMKQQQNSTKILYQRIFECVHLSSSKQERFLKMVSTCLKNDDKFDRICALSKRLFQAALDGSPGLAVAAFLTVWEGFTHSNNKRSISPFIRFPEQETADELQVASNHSATENNHSQYNGFVRDPLRSNASLTCFWEMNLLSYHFHPSVSLFASKMLDTCEMPTYGGHPLKDFSLASFFERFTHRNPKTATVDHLRGSCVANSNILANSISLDTDFIHGHFKLPNVKEEIEKKVRQPKVSTPVEKTDSDDDDEIEEEFHRQLMHRFGHENEEDDDILFDNDTDETDEDDWMQDDSIPEEATKELLEEDFDVSNYMSPSQQDEQEIPHKKPKKKKVALKQSARLFAPVEEYFDD